MHSYDNLPVKLGKDDEDDEDDEDDADDEELDDGPTSPDDDVGITTDVAEIEFELPSESFLKVRL